MQGCKKEVESKSGSKQYQSTPWLCGEKTSQRWKPSPSGTESGFPRAKRRLCTRHGRYHQSRPEGKPEDFLPWPAAPSMAPSMAPRLWHQSMTESTWSISCRAVTPCPCTKTCKGYFFLKNPPQYQIMICRFMICRFFPVALQATKA